MLTPNYLNKLDQLRIQSRKTYSGKYRGERRSKNRGTGIEFTDYRHYEPGDDLRYLDWNVYARLEKPFIKLFQADEELSVSILIDISQSMSFGQPSKLEYAKLIASVLGYITLTNTDRVSVYTLSDQLSKVVPSIYGKSQFICIERALSPIQAQGLTNLNVCLKHLSNFQPKVGVVVIVSDFLDSNGYTEGISTLLGRGFTVSLIHLQSREEIELLPPGDWQIEDSESGEKKEITINDDTFDFFQEEMESFRNTLKIFCKQNAINYLNLSTQMEIESVIIEDLLRTGVVEYKN
ncbi:DUF58 domain-containing protein [Candidatus Poribacteria bacterium]|nr:DUF58 domain-containing protein [Candidatus Poribacteria bacterium]